MNLVGPIDYIGSVILMWLVSSFHWGARYRVTEACTTAVLHPTYQDIHMTYKSKRPKVEGGERSKVTNAETRVVAKQLQKLISKFRSVRCATTNLRLLNQKSLRDLLLAIELCEGELTLAQAKVRQYQDFRNQQGRKGRGRKKSKDTEPDEKEVKEREIKKEVEKLQSKSQLSLF